MVKKNKTEKKEGVNISTRRGRQILYVIIGMLLILLALFIFYLINSANNNFTFLGLKWDKQKFGEIPLYHAQIEVTRDDGSSGLFDLYLRNDPRTLNLPNDSIRFRRDIVYFSVNNSIGANCEEGTVAFSDLGKFFGALGIQAKVGVIDKNESELLNLPYITCENSVNSSVFIFQGGDKTSITSYGNCNVVEVSNCEIIKAAETIMVGTISK